MVNVIFMMMFFVSFHSCAYKMESAVIRSVLGDFISPNELQNAIAFESWENIAYIM